MKKFILVLAVSFAVALQANALDWRKVSLEGGSTQQILADRSHPGVWFSVVSDRLYRSTDSGLHWQQNGLRKVREAQIHSPSGRVYAVAGEYSSQIWSSQDGGKSFKLQAQPQGQLRNLVVDPDDTNRMYAFGIGAHDFAVSHDGGRRWRAFQFPDPVKLGCDADCQYYWNDLLISPQDHETLYLSGNFNYGDPPRKAFGLFLVSIDSGKTWNFSRQPSVSFHTDPAFPGRAFAFNDRGVMELMSNRWITISRTGMREIASVPGRRGMLYGLHRTREGAAQIMRSTDGGRVWKSMADDLHQQANRLASGDPELLLAGTDGAGIFRKEPTAEWQRSSNGFKDVSVKSVTVSGTHIYTLDITGRWLFRSADGGMNCDVNNVPALSEVHAAPGDPLHLVGILDNGQLAMSRDGGRSWTSASGLPEDYYYALAFDPSNSQTVYVAGSIDPVALFKSFDGGASFDRSPAVFPRAVYHINNIVVDRNNSQILYFLTTDGMYKSMDSGSSAQKANSGITCLRCPLEPYSLVPLDQDNSYLLSLADGGLFRTEDGGNSWRRAGRIPGFFIHQMVSAGEGGSHLVALSENNDDFHSDVFESTNAGKDWVRLDGQIDASINFRNLSDTSSLPVFLSSNRGLFLLTNNDK